TGRPKPVGVTRGGLANLMEAQAPAFGLTPADSVLQFSSLSFDASVSEIFVTLGAGATLALLRGERTAPAAIEAAAATVATLPPPRRSRGPCSRRGRPARGRPCARWCRPASR